MTLSQALKTCSTGKNTRMWFSIFRAFICLSLFPLQSKAADETAFGYPLVDNLWIDTGDFMGWLQLQYAPWVYCLDLNSWIYLTADEEEDLQAVAGVWVYSQVGPNQGEEVQMATSVSQNDVTWTFDKEYQVGQFANGEWWVLGPVTITSISPAWNGTTNGAMVNPVSRGTRHGFDTRIRYPNVLMTP